MVAIKFISRCCLLAALPFFLAMPALRAQGTALEPVPVLVLHSYHAEYPWTARIQAGLKSVFEPAGVETVVEYMDTKRVDGPAYRQSLCETYRIKYGNRRPRLLLTTDDNALQFALDCRENLFPDIPLVFCGVNDYKKDLLGGHADVTGVVEDFDLKSTLDVALTLHPDARRIAVVNDATVSGRHIGDRLRRILPRYRDRVAFLFLENLSIQEMASALDQLGPGDLLLYLTFQRDRNGESLSVSESMQLMREHCRVPIYNSWDHMLGSGVVGGMMVSGFEQGRTAAKLAMRVLDGASADALPVTTDSPNRFMFDDRQLRRFQIPASRLPGDSIVAFRPDSFFHRHRAAIGWGLAAALGFVLFTVVLLVKTVALRRAEKRLAASERKYRLIAENATDMVSTHDADGVYTYASPACRGLIGYDPEDLVGEDAYRFFHPEDLEAIRKSHKTILNDRGIYTVSYRLRHKAGHYVWVETRSQTIRNPATEAIEEIICGTRDITERKKAEAARFRMERRIQESQRLESLGVMAGGIAHDFNNILMIVLGNIELAKVETRGNPAVQLNLTQSENAIQRAVEIVRQMLTYAGKRRPVAHQMDIDELISGIAELIRAAVSEHVHVDFRPGGDLPTIMGDPSQLQQAVMNLVLNAAEAIEDVAAGGTVVISTGIETGDAAFLPDTVSEVWANYDAPFEAARYVIVEVRDDGSGLDADTRKRIFEPFFTTKFLGRGLGLSAVLGIVRGHRGYISLNSEPGRGTAVRLLFPIPPAGPE